MDELLDQLEQLTAEMILTLNSATYEQVCQFVDRRGEIVARMQQQPQNKDHSGLFKERLQRVLQHDQQVLDKLDELKNTIGTGMAKLSNARTQMNAYNAVYTPDSGFIDKRN